MSASGITTTEDNANNRVTSYTLVGAWCSVIGEETLDYNNRNITTLPITFEFDYFDVNKTHALNGLVIRLLDSKNKNESEFVVWGSGNPIREWVYMPDVAKIIKEIIDLKKFDLFY